MSLEVHLRRALRGSRGALVHPRGGGPRRYPLPRSDIPGRSGPDVLNDESQGSGELGLCSVSAAVANAIYNATGVRVRGYPITTDKLLDGLPEIV